MHRLSLGPLCTILLASLLASTACKHAPTTPSFTESSEAASELAELEEKRAELLKAQEQNEADLKLAEQGWPEGAAAPKVEASYSSKGGVYDDSETIEYKTQIKKAVEKGDKKSCQSWMSKLLARCKSRKQELSKIIVEVEVKIETTKKKLPEYGDIIQKGQNNSSSSSSTDTDAEGTLDTNKNSDKSSDSGVKASDSGVKASESDDKSSSKSLPEPPPSNSGTSGKCGVSQNCNSQSKGK